MSLLFATCLDNLRSIGGVDLKNFGLAKFPPAPNIYGTSSSWGQPPVVDEAGWLCGFEGNGVGEYRGQNLTTITLDKNKVYCFGARWRNINNSGYGLFRFGSSMANNEPVLTNNPAFGFAPGTGTPEAFVEIEIDFVADRLRFYKDGVLAQTVVFSSNFTQLYSDISNSRPLAIGFLFKNATAWTNQGAGKVSADQFKVRDMYGLVDDGIGVTKRLGPVNIRRAPVIVTSVSGADKNAAAAQTTLNQPLVNTASGGAWSKAAGAVKLTGANSAVNFKLDLSGIPGKKIAAGVIVGGRRAATVQPVVELSQTVDGTKYTNTGVIAFPTTTADVVDWTIPRTEFAAANVELANVDFSLTLKDPA